ncbi:MAG: class I SAM-dependent methyltransferase [Thermomicrobium sp.]|nr:class I SAM-dependent methyltransferase [Thermomicrobium sp.]
MTSPREVIFEELIRGFGRPAPVDPARRRLLDTLRERNLLRSGSDVLVLAPTAELVGELAARGVHPTVVEPLASLLEHLRQRIGSSPAPVHWLRRDPHRLPFRRAFDLVLATGLVLGTTGREADDEELLRALLAAVRSGGTIVLELPNRELLVRDFVERLWGTFDRLLVLVQQRWELPAGTLRIDWQLLWPDGTREQAERTLRLYAASELAQLCRRVGCSALEYWGNDDGAPYELWSPRLLLVVRTEEEATEPLVVGGEPRQP